MAETAATFNVLVVEDSPVESTLTQRMLAARGTVWNVKAVDRLAAAIQQLAASPPDIVLLDLHLPDSRGLETLGRIKAAAPDVPIVVLTGTEDEDLGLQALRQGAQDYLLKRQWGSALLSRTLRYAVERFRAEKALRASEAYLRTLFENAPVGITVVNPELKVVEVNQAQADILGRSRDELKNGTFNDAVRTDQDCSAMIGKVFEDGAAHAQERVRLTRKAGEVLWVDLTVLPIREDTRPVTRAVVITQNVTERELLSQERDQFVQELNRLRGA